jgi:16S rRNA processing protein RimM
MLQKDCFLLGHVVKPYSFKGEVILFIDSDNPKHYYKLESVFVEINKKLIPFFITSIVPHNQVEYLRVRFEGIDNEQQAKDITGKQLFLPLNQLPPLKKGEYYLHDLIGYSVFENGVKLGIVSELYDLPNNRLLEFQYQGKEVLAPFKDELIERVDTEEKAIHLLLPEGLLDIYTSSTNDDDKDY